MKRKITILTIAFLSSMLMYANAFAAATGRCGDSITWTLDDSGNLTLSGSGEMWNYGYVTSPFKDYGIKTVTIEYGITSIGESAFLGCRGMTELTLPNSVRSIGGNAFEGCSGLTELTLPNSVTSIGDYAFFGCSGLTELTLPNGVMSIGGNAFEGCSGLTELTLPNSVTSIADDAFRGCCGLTELTLPNSVTSIGTGAFAYCSGLTELTLSNSLTSIGKYAFKGCSGLAKITSLAEIPPVCGSGVFDGVNKTNCELIVPEGSVAAYKQAEVWNEFSNISGFSGVEDTVADGNTIRVIGNQIEISGDFTSVEVYGVNGVLIYKGKDNVVTVPSAGIYLVHVAGKTRKIVVE
ncbi:MAG: leucine-rich repeat protein [Muribaculaceae bacterium]|nr:leucine-rich repeat protein [Muribaculaceae bacterium]